MTVDVHADAIPEELTERDQWLLWDASNETPRRPHWRGDFTISWSDPDDWHTFDEAVAAAEEEPSWGIGYVTAADNDDHPHGIYGVIDIDGCVHGAEGRPKEWVPSLDEMLDFGAYVEWSPSGEGLHIPVVGADAPDWWTDEHFTDDEHEGVEFLTNKFCTFTGNTLRGSGDEIVAMGDGVRSWLREAQKALTGDDPQSDGSNSDADWGVDTVREMLDHIDADCGYPRWRDIGFALHDHFDGAQEGKRLFEDWSQTAGAKYDSDAEEYIDRIWNDATPGGGRTIGTVVHLATQNGWEPPSRSEYQPEPSSDPGEESVQERVARRVLMPLNPPEESDANPIPQEEARERLTDILTDEYHFVHPREDTRGWRETLYVYTEEDGIYEPYGEEFLSREIERLTGRWATNQRVNEVINKVKRRSRVRVRRLEADPERIVVRNGVLDLTTGELSEHTPEEYHRTMVDVPHDPDADCPAIDEFMHDVVEERDVDTLYRLVAHCLYKDYAAEKAAMLLGDGRNGKSVFLKLVEEFLGEWNVSNQSLQKLNEDDWAANNLAGKLANVHPDMSDETAETMQMFKKLTGGDTVSADVKFERPIRFENYATLLFACNRMPVLNDDSRGNWRRWLLIEFPYTFEPGDPQTEDKDVLLNRLTAEEELSGLLNRCVEEISAWDDGREWFPNAPDWEETRSRIRQAAEPVVDFAASCLRDAEDGWEAKKDVRRAYQAYATANGLPTMGREKFGKKLLYETDLVIEAEQKRENGHRVRAYAGIELTERGRQLLKQRGDTGDGDGGETQQSAFGGPQGRAERVVELCREHADDGRVPAERLLGMAIGDGMTPEQAEAAIQKARNQGDLAGSDELLPT